MPGFEKIFITNFMEYASDLEPEAETILENTLAMIWKEFSEEYEWVAISDLDERFSKFIWIAPTSKAPAE
jgi:hypothetical protein